MNIKLLRKGDLAVIAAVIISVLIFVLFNNLHDERPVAVITVNGKTVETVDLSVQKEKLIISPAPEYNVTVVAENGEIYFENSDCDDKLCVAVGRLKKCGDTAVCLPAKTVITVKGSEVDAVVY